MSDLIQRLRIGIHTSADEQVLRREAADRIEALEAALHGVVDRLLEVFPDLKEKQPFKNALAVLAGEKKDG